MPLSEKSEEKSVEFMLINVKMETMPGGEMIFLDNHNQFNDPNIMIADTGETCNLTAWQMVNMKSAGAEYTITSEKREETRQK